MDDLHLWCSPGWLIGMFGSLQLLGFAISMTTMKLGDVIGRHRYMYILSILNILTLTGLIWIPLLWARLLLVFLHGCLAVRIAISYVLCSEFFP